MKMSASACTDPGESGKSRVSFGPPHRIFDRAHRGGADRDAWAGGCLLERVEGAGGNLIPLVVDIVVEDVVHLDRVEGADADLQGEVVELSAAASRSAMRSGVKCRPAVGAATATRLS